MKIYCVIVTYNRLDLLKESVASIQGQTRIPDKIIVVNNNSIDGTREYLDEISSNLVQSLHLDENIGGAGGFYTGIKRAYEDGADWVWIMDDDTVATRTALQELVESPMFDPSPMFEHTGFLASRVDWVSGERCRMNIPALSWEWNWFNDRNPGCFRINACSFVSILINRKAIERVGYPIKELFIWFDDWEYTQRISRLPDFPCFYVNESVVVHKTPDNNAVSYADINESNIWKYKYGIRNEMSLESTSTAGRIRAALLLARNLKIMRQAGVGRRLRLGILLSGLKGYVFNYRKYIELPRT